MKMEMSDGLNRGVSDTATVFSSSVFRAGLEEIEVAVENVLDTEKDLPKSSSLHQWCKRSTMLGKR